MSFDNAFNITMGYEVGSWFDPKDPETIAGLCDTKAQKKKTGYVNDTSDKGGETKFGISARAYPKVDIKRMTLAQARDLYVKDYWKKGSCDKLPNKVATLHFDTCVLHGIAGGARLLQRALLVAEDGIIGPGTIGAANAADPGQLFKQYISERRVKYFMIVKADPSQQKFYQGWLNRVKDIENRA